MMYRYGMGPRMMSSYEMGSGMMHGLYGGCGANVLNLTDQQRSKIADIWERMFKSAWPVMGQLQEQYFQFARLDTAASPDQAAIDKAYTQISALKKQLLDLHLQARDDMNGVLAPEQRKQFRQSHHWY